MKDNLRNNQFLVLTISHPVNNENIKINLIVDNEEYFNS